MRGTGLDRNDDFQKFCKSWLDRIKFFQIRTELGLKNFTVHQRCAWTGFRIFRIRTPAASNRIRSLVFLPVAGPGLDLDFVLTEKTLLVVHFTDIQPDSNRSRIPWI